MIQYATGQWASVLAQMQSLWLALYGHYHKDSTQLYTDLLNGQNTRAQAYVQLV